MGKEENENTAGEYLREHIKAFSKSVFEAFSDFLSEVLKYTSDERERDMLLLVTITMLSTVFHNTNGYYNKKMVSSYLYAFIIALHPENHFSKLENPDKVSLIPVRIPDEFTTTQFIDSTITLNLKERRVHGLLKKYMNLYISKINKSVYRNCP